MDLRRLIVRWPRHCGHHGVVQQVPCGRADALGMVTINLSGICGWSPTLDTRGWGGVDLCRPIVRWPRNWGHHGVVHQVGCGRSDAIGMFTINLCGICGWSPTRACTRVGRVGLVSPNSSMATRLGTPWRGATGRLRSIGCPGDGHHQSLWHLRVVANAPMHAVGAGWTCVAQ